VLRRRVAVLLKESEEFARLWDEHEVGTRSGSTKRILHPLVGTLDLHCEILAAENATERLVVFVPSPGSDDERRLASLALPENPPSADCAPVAVTSHLVQTTS
jgi:hypothetical protein